MRLPSNQSGRLSSNGKVVTAFSLFSKFHFLPPFSLHIFLEALDPAAAPKLADGGCPLHRAAEDEHIAEVLDRALHLTGFHKTVIQRVILRFRCVFFLPISEQVQIVRKHRKTQPLQVTELLCLVVRYFFCRTRRCVTSGLQEDAEVRRKSSGCIAGIKPGELRRQVEHVPGLPAAEAVEVVGVHLHARCAVIVERAAGHATAIDRQIVPLRRHLRRDLPLDGFI